MKCYYLYQHIFKCPQFYADNAEIIKAHVMEMSRTKTVWNNTFVLVSSILRKKTHLDCLVIYGEVDLKERK